MPFLIVRQRIWQTNLMASGTKLRCLVQWLKKSLFVKGRLPFNHLPIEELKPAVLASGKRIMHRFFNGIIRIASWTVYMRNRMARRTGNSRVSGWIVFHIKIRIIKSAAKKRHHVVTPRAPPRSLHIAVPLHQKPPSFLHAKQIRWIVEGTKMMRAVEPTFIGIRMTLLAILIHH